MAYLVITQLRLNAGTDWVEIQSQTTAVCETLAEHDPFEGLHLVRVDATSGVLLARFSDEPAAVRLWSEFAGPRLVRQLSASLAAPPATTEGELVFEFERATDHAEADIATVQGPERVHAFVRAIVASGGLWGLYGETWARSSAAGEAEALPCWPDAECAARCVRGEWAEFAPRKIALDTYLEQWLNGMDEDGIRVVVFPTPRHAGTVVEPKDLATAIRAQLAATCVS